MDVALGRLRHLEEVEIDDYWKGTIWPRIAQDRQVWNTMPSPSPNHGAQRLHNDDDDMLYIYAELHVL